MNGKNIKKALKARIDDWIKHIDDEAIVRTIKDNAIITGGAIVSMLQGEEPHDYDVYFKTKEACVKVANYYADIFNKSHDVQVDVQDSDDRIQCFVKSEGVAAESPSDETQQEEKPKYRPVFFSTNAISLSDKIQVVIRFYGSAEEIHKNYDFVHCTCYFDYKESVLSLPSRALEAIINKELYYIGSKYPVCSIIRTRKFLERGWTINAGQYLKMCLQVSDLDLKDLETFKDQLNGVDSAYFSRAIELIEAKQKEDADFKVDNSYLFEVINRIF
jgi:hypothetical protein